MDLVLIHTLNHAKITKLVLPIIDLRRAKNMVTSRLVQFGSLDQDAILLEDRGTGCFRVMQNFYFICMRSNLYLNKNYECNYYPNYFI